MEEQTIVIGSTTVGSGGIVIDTTKTVQFQAELLGERREPGLHKELPSDTRGLDQALYKLADDRLIVHSNHWSQWQGEPTVSRLLEITETDLQVGGQFEALGTEAGFGRPLSIDEALAEERTWEKKT